MYLNVLEHIEKDTVEINDALEKLDDNGYLIILELFIMEKLLMMSRRNQYMINVIF